MLLLHDVMFFTKQLLEGVNKLMKRIFLLLALVSGILLLLTSCFLFFKPGKPFTFFVVEYNSGPGIEGARVDVYVSGGGVFDTVWTGIDGRAEVKVPADGLIDVVVSKYGYALSKVEGLDANAIENEVYEIIMRKAKLKPEPFASPLPEVNVQLFTPDGSPLNSYATVTSDVIKVKVDVVTTNHVRMIYAALGKVLGSSYMTDPRGYTPDSTTAEFEFSTEGFKGLTDLHVVVYDYNDNRVDKVLYLNIIPKTYEGSKYAVQAPSEKGLVAYTRRSGIAFYKVPSELKKALGNTFKYFEPTAAPKDCNLWIEVRWKSYLEAVKEGSVSTATTLEPDGYNVYRSFDGLIYERIAFVPESAGGLYRDKSALLKPNKPVYYKVCAVYGTEETMPLYLGSVTPLDTFEVDLIYPYDGAVNVPRAPTFTWKPTVSLHSDEGTVTYYYAIWLYDLVQAENHIMPIIIDGTDVYYTAFYTSEATEIGVNFADYKWGIYIGGKLYVYPYEKLEPNKSYSWGMGLAAASVEDEDSVAYSICVDYGYGFDPFRDAEADTFPVFTTAAE